MRLLVSVGSGVPLPGLNLQQSFLELPGQVHTRLVGTYSSAGQQWRMYVTLRRNAEKCGAGLTLTLGPAPRAQLTTIVAKEWFVKCLIGHGPCQG